MASKQKKKPTPKKATPVKATPTKKAAPKPEEAEEVEDVPKDSKTEDKKPEKMDVTEAEAAEDEVKETEVEVETEAGEENGEREEEAEEEDRDEAKEHDSGAEEEKEDEGDQPETVEIDDDDDEEDVIIVKDDDKEQGEESKDKKKTDDTSWVDIIEREKDGKLHAELFKIKKLITASQKGKEIQDLARTHRLHLYPLYPEDLSDPFIMDMMKNCTQTKVTFCCSKKKDEEQKFCGFMEFSFTKLKFLEENKEKLTTLRDDIKFMIGGHRSAIDDFTNDWIKAAGLPENADANNKLTLFAPSLPASVTIDELWELFGQAREIWLIPGAPRQHAYIKFANEESLQSTLADLKSRGPPREDFNFCRLVRFYDVQRVIKNHSGVRHARDGGGRRSSIGSAGNRTRDRQKSRWSPPPSRAASSQSKTATAGKDQKKDSTSTKKTSDADKNRSSDKAQADSKGKASAKPTDKDSNRSRSKDQDNKNADRARARSSGARADRDRRNPVQSRSNDRQRTAVDRQRRPAVDRPPRRFRDDRVGSLLGEPPMVPSLMGPSMMNNTPLERSLTQLQMPVHQQPPMQIRDDRGPQGLQVLDSLLSTLGQLSHQGDNPIETLAHALHSPPGGGYSDHSRRDDDRGYGGPSRRDDRRGRSPMKRPMSPNDGPPLTDMDMKRRRDHSRPTANTNRPRDYPQEIPRDYNQARPAANMQDGYKSGPRHTAEAAVPARRTDFAGDYARRPAATGIQARGFDNTTAREPMDNYDTSARVPRGNTYEERHAEATGEIARMESEYARLMDQLGQSNAQRATSSSYASRPSYY